MSYFKYLYTVVFVLITFGTTSYSIASDEDKSKDTASLEQSIQDNELLKSILLELQEVKQQNLELQQQFKEESGRFVFKYPLKDGTESVSVNEYEEIIERIVLKFEKPNNSPLASDIDLELHEALLSSSIKLGDFNNTDSKIDYSKQQNIQVDPKLFEIASRKENSALKKALEEFERLNKRDLLALEKSEFENIKHDVRELLVVAVLYENLKFKEAIYSRKNQSSKNEENKEYFERMELIYKKLSDVLLRKLQFGFELLSRSVGDSSSFQYSANIGLRGFGEKWVLRRKIAVSKLANHFWLALLARHESTKSFQNTYDRLDPVFHKYEMELYPVLNILGLYQSDKVKFTRIRWEILKTSAIYVITGVGIGYHMMPEPLLETLMIPAMTVLNWLGADVTPNTFYELVEPLTYLTTSAVSEYIGNFWQDLQRANVGTLTGAFFTGFYIIGNKIKNHFKSDKEKTFLEVQNKSRKLFLKQIIDDMKERRSRMRSEAFGYRLGQRYRALKAKCVDLLSGSSTKDQ